MSDQAEREARYAEAIVNADPENPSRAENWIPEARAVMALADAENEAQFEINHRLRKDLMRAEGELRDLRAEVALWNDSYLGLAEARRRAEAEAGRLTALVDLYRAEWAGTHQHPDCTCGGISACLACQEADATPTPRRRLRSRTLPDRGGTCDGGDCLDCTDPA